jgi:hypothetical protein
MQTKDTNGKLLSNTFSNVISSNVQYIKPKAIIDFRDARHLSGISISTNDPHASSTAGSLGFFFNKEDVVSGVDYETFAWGVAGAIDKDGIPITASGEYLAMPSNLDDNFKYGWWSATKSNGSKTFATNPNLDINFTSTKVNKVKVITSEIFGAVSQINIKVYSTAGGNILDTNYTFNTPNNVFEKVFNLNQTYSDIYRVLITVISTSNASDYAKIVSVIPLYQVDISNSIISLSSSRVRDLHETSLPIAGTSQTSAQLSIDNTDKTFNPLSNNSLYGKYLDKDIKVKLSNGWKITGNSPDEVETFLTANLASSGATYLYVNNATDMPNGDISNTALESNYFLLTIDKNTPSEEQILVKKKIDNVQLEIAQRGFNNTDAIAHSSSASVSFDPFEYTSIGSFYLEEVSLSASDLNTNLTLQDKFKFLNDKTLDQGFFRQDTTVPLAVRDLLMFGNFPRKNIVVFNRYSDWPSQNDAILQFKFNDLSKNISNTYSPDGLRYRVYSIKAGSEGDLKDFKLDARDIPLSELDKAMGLAASVTPTFTGVKSDIALSSYSFSNDLAGARNTYYQGVFDGYWYPKFTETFQLGLNINQGGARIYIDDEIAIDAWKNHTATRYYSISKSVVAGYAHKIRVEFFHNGASTFDISVVRNVNQGTIGFLRTNLFDDNIGMKGISNSTAITSDLKSFAIPSNYVAFSAESAIAWDTEKSSAYISNTASGNASVVDSFIRVPYDKTWNPTDSSIYPKGNWAIEVLFKAPSGAFGGQGEYIGTYGNAAPTYGFELFYISSTNHGLRVRSNSGTTVTLTSSIAMPNGGNSWNHIIVTYNSYVDTIYYYVNGVFQTSATGSSPRFGTSDLTIGGRGSSFNATTGVTVKPTSTISNAGITMYIDELSIYKSYLNSDLVTRRYQETQIKEMRKFPFLYAFKDSIYQSLMNISFADLGRIYIDEEERFIYEHYYAFFEPSIGQHSNVQMTLSDSDYLVNASLTKTLQVNSVIVKVSGLATRSINYQSIWRAPDNTTLGVINLTSNITANSSSIPVSSFDIVPFPKSGYVIIDNEIIKYNNTDTTNFLSIERAALNTTAAIHNANSKVREVRYYDFEYDKSPAFSVKSPFVTGIEFEDPAEVNLLVWKSSPFKANLVIAASNDVESNSVVFLEGTDPLTNKVSYTSIAGIPVQIEQNSGEIKQQTANNSENRRKFGLKEIIIDSPYITDAVYGQTIADFVIDKLSEPIPILSVESILTPKLQVGDRIRLGTIDQLDISNSDYWITSIETSIGSSYNQSMELRKVV